MPPEGHLGKFSLQYPEISSSEDAKQLRADRETCLERKKMGTNGERFDFLNVVTAVINVIILGGSDDEKPPHAWCVASSCSFLVIQSTNYTVILNGEWLSKGRQRRWGQKNCIKLFFSNDISNSSRLFRHLTKLIQGQTGSVRLMS